MRERQDDDRNSADGTMDEGHKAALAKLDDRFDQDSSECIKDESECVTKNPLGFGQFEISDKTVLWQVRTDLKGILFAPDSRFLVDIERLFLDHFSRSPQSGSYLYQLKQSLGDIDQDRDFGQACRFFISLEQYPLYSSQSFGF
jgi:hypothetical protein